MYKKQNKQEINKKIKRKKTKKIKRKKQIDFFLYSKQCSSVSFQKKE
jgi:hypothetical protein